MNQQPIPPKVVEVCNGATVKAASGRPLSQRELVQWSLIRKPTTERTAGSR
jgi:hypothetical protein